MKIIRHISLLLALLLLALPCLAQVSITGRILSAFGGDTMMGRRFSKPAQGDPVLIREWLSPPLGAGDVPIHVANKQASHAGLASR